MGREDGATNKYRRSSHSGGKSEAALTYPRYSIQNALKLLIGRTAANAVTPGDLVSKGQKH